ncbi:Hypothetical protein A7982_01665 [Minicystis rosea]|nr:Hypothetical protein A7982_01665 [Minicystis rosea]
MNQHVKDVAEECTKASDESRLTFPEVLAKLSEVGIEQYHADLLRSEKTYYLGSGGSVVVAAAPVERVPAAGFVASDVAAAVRASQAGAIDYHTFCERVAAAGCTGYFVSLVGRRVVYFGRTAESYVEPFPGSGT